MRNWKQNNTSDDRGQPENHKDAIGCSHVKPHYLTFLSFQNTSVTRSSLRIIFLFRMGTEVLPIGCLRYHCLVPPPSLLFSF